MNELLTIDGKEPLTANNSLKLMVQMANEISIQASKISQIEDKVVRMEHTLEHEVYLTSAQARAVQNAISTKVLSQVKLKNATAAEIIESRGAKRTLYSQLYKSLKDRFRVSTYREIPRQQFSSALLFIEEWFPITGLRGIGA